MPKSDRRGISISAGWKRQHGGKDMPSNWRSPPRPGEKSPEQGRLLLHSGLRSHAELPQDKQVGVPPRDAPQPVHRRAFSTFEPLELPLRPSCESLIEVTEHLNALRAVISPVVVHPSPHRRVGQASQILQTLVVPGGRHSPLANGLPDRLGGLVADRRQEADKILPPAILRASRLKGVAEEVELDMFVAPRPAIFLAGHDPGLLWMKLQAAFCEATADGFQHRSSFLLAPAVDDSIVRITLEADARVVPIHPPIECIVQEQIGEQRTNDTALRGSLPPLHERSVRTFDRGAQPPSNVETNPSQIRVAGHGAFDEVVRNGIKERFDVQIYNPV